MRRRAHRSSSGRRRIPMRFVAAAVGAALVLGNVVLVLVPVLGLVGAATSFGPIVPVPVAQIAIAIVVGFLVASGCIVLAGRSRPRWLTWSLAVAAWVASLIASTWPILVTAAAAVDRIGDVIPFIIELIRSLG